MTISPEHFSTLAQSGIFGFIVGDALGVPVEFTDRETREADPVRSMRSGGAHGQTAGTWSDDTSMTLGTMHSLTYNGIDYEDTMNSFAKWLWDAAFTAHDEVFDVGGATRGAIMRYMRGAKALDCGDASEWACGNGSLMRMLPVALYLAGQQAQPTLNDETAAVIHNYSACTHAHKRCLMACGIYCNVVFHLLRGETPAAAVAGGVAEALNYYAEKAEFSGVYKDFADLSGVAEWKPSRLRGSGYVLHTLQASLWCLLTTDSYTECVLKAVNLGEDTDTTGAVAGSLAGLCYGIQSIPVEWVDILPKKEEIQALTQRFAAACLA